MPKFFVAVYHPADFDPSMEDESIHRAIDVLNDEMVAAGIRAFVGGLHGRDEAYSFEPNSPAGTAPKKSLRVPANEHIGGFWVLELPTMEEALEWGRKASVACRTAVEVRQFH
jgi:hypothetical protein